MKLRKNKRYLDLPIKLENPGKRTHLLVFKKQYHDPANFIKILTLVTNIKDLFTPKYWWPFVGNVYVYLVWMNYSYI